MSVTNPFFDVSTLPYQAPRFDLIHQDHYRPAFDRGVEEKRAEVSAIAQTRLPPRLIIPCCRWSAAVSC